MQVARKIAPCGKALRKRSFPTTERIREAVHFASSQLLKRFATQRTLPLEIDDARPKLNGTVEKVTSTIGSSFPGRFKAKQETKKPKKVTNPEIYVEFLQNYILI